MKPIFIKSIFMAALAAVVPVHSVASAASSTDIEEVTTVTTSDCFEDDTETEVICECTCDFSVDNNGLCTITTIDEDGNEKTYTLQLDEKGNGELQLDDQVFNISGYGTEAEEGGISVSSEYIIDDGADDGIVVSGTCAVEEDENGELSYSFE